jgi:hypothetical protein
MERSENSGRDIINAENLPAGFDFFELLRILWKRRYIILLGTAAVVAMIVAISFSMPKIIRSQMILKPGLSHVDKKGKWVLLDVPSNMQFRIESELKYKLEKQLRESKDNKLLLPLNYQTLADNSRNTLTVFYDSSGLDDGVAKLKILLNALRDSYDRTLQTYLKRYDSNIAMVRQDIAHKLKEQEFIKSNLSGIQISLNKYKQNNALEVKNSPAGKKGQYLVDLTAIIERISRLMQALSRTDLRIAELNDKLARLETEKKRLTPLHLVQTPTRIAGPSRTNLVVNLLASPVIGFFIMVFLVLFVEYLRKVIAKIKQDKIFV